MSQIPQKTAQQLFRDCLRLTQHIAGNSPKGVKIRRIVKSEFLRNKSETDPQKIEALRGNAVRALTNYLMMESSMKDPRLNQHVKDLRNKDTEELRKQK